MATSEERLEMAEKNALYILKLERIVEMAKGGFQTIISMAGNPNASEGCRLIIKEALAKIAEMEGEDAMGFTIPLSIPDVCFFENEITDFWMYSATI